MTEKNTVERTIVVVGAGTSGWLAASAIKKQNPDINVTLVHDSKIKTIGVGETIYFGMPRFNREILGIKDHEWMNAVNATYKIGLNIHSGESPTSFSVTAHINDFPSDCLKLSHTGTNIAYEKHQADISQHDQYGEYGSIVDLWASMYQAGHLGTNTERMFADISEGYWFVKNNKSIYDLNGNCITNPWVGHSYHYDAALFSTVIGNLVGKPAGVVEIDSTVIDVTTDSNQNIKSITLANGQVIHADCFVDCTGFRKLLVSKTQNEWIDSDEFYNNSALVTPIFYDDHENRTHSVNNVTHFGGMKCGWRFSVPLQHRSGNGYVFNSRIHPDVDQHAEELDQVIANPNPGKHRLIQWQPGRYRHAIENNCFSLGLALGFTDPFDANNLVVTCCLIEGFVNQLKTHGNDPDWLLKTQNHMNIMNHNLWDDVDIRVQSWLRLSPRSDTEHYRLMTQVAVDTRLEEKFIQRIQDMRNRTLPNLHKFYMRSWAYIAVATRYGIKIPSVKLDNDIMELAKNYFEFNSRKWKTVADSAPSMQEFNRNIKNLYQN
jgi:hypothetical protein